MSSHELEVLNSSMTNKQKAFCIEYLKDLNGKQAAIRAGYSEKTAAVIASENLMKPYLMRYIIEANAARMKTINIDANLVLENLSELATSNVAEMFDENDILIPINKMPENVQKTIQAFEVEEVHERDDDGEIMSTTKTVRVKLWNKDKALENLGRHLKLFTEQVEHSNPDGNMGPQVIITLPSNGREKVE